MDDAIGRLLDFLQAEGLGEPTLVIYMATTASRGRTRTVDKRNFYEPSVRVPMLAYCPELIPAGRTVEEMVQNIDVAPTIMAACGLAKAPQMCGESFLPLLKGGTAADWAQAHLLRILLGICVPPDSDRFRSAHRPLQIHPLPRHLGHQRVLRPAGRPLRDGDLIDHPELQDTIRSLANDLYDWLETTGGMQIPLKRSVYYRHGDHRNAKTY